MYQYSVAQLELDVRDAIDQADVTPPERVTLLAISNILRQARRSRQVSVEQRTIIVLERKAAAAFKRTLASFPATDHPAAAAALARRRAARKPLPTGFARLHGTITRKV